ncbi:M18 family aminopeptidase [Egibacter rhizosphaerae]|uniref:M18 family aminopeptidase n=1 Tax=Egibacter rhizosphaerae TaxID=1670831 RepID=A0A411YE88_9ACTN|nr:M18 family aminopeptidase [Egibacter rhizosphaerae]QBI19417.1 M18 family aminopeptidase [Egibacter rhizosphaerae]
MSDHETHIDFARDLLAFVDAGPSPFHVVGEMARRLEAAGFTELDEAADWSLRAGDRRYVVRDGGSIVAFRVGSAAPADGGFRLVGAHTDSPALKLRPHPEVSRHGYRLAGCEPYGGLLLHTWFDRDLTLAGRVAVRAGDGAVRLERVHLPGAPLRIPSLAIHLDRSVRTDGFKPDPQQHVVPVHGPDGDGCDALLDLIAEAADVARTDLLGWDLVTADTQPAAFGDGPSIRAPRLDNLASCHAGVQALLEAEVGPATAALVANDHEEVGSGSAEGARGSFLGDVLARIVAATGEEPAVGLPRAMSRSLLVSSDTAHAVHPNYADRHEPEHRPRLGGGPAIKDHAGQAYASDAATASQFVAACAEVGVTPQRFASRADLPCGSTIGPLTATRLGLPTVDIGAPILSMHSVREQADARDIVPTVASLRAHLSGAGRIERGKT